MRTLSYIFMAVLYAASFQHAEAKSITWQQQFTDYLTACSHFGSAAPPASCVWKLILIDPNISVRYGATVTNLDTGQQVTDGIIVPVGTNLRLSTVPHISDDLYWFGTGYAYDSPYGDWVNTVSNPATGCDAKDFVSNPSGIASIYMPWIVATPQGKTIDTSATLSCGPTSTDANGTISQDCTVASAGAINVTFNFPSTYGKFYQRYYQTSCIVSQYAMRSGGSPGNPPSQSVNPPSPSDYVTTIPARSISISFVATAPNQPPNPPAISGPISGQPNTPYTYSFQATDPENNDVLYNVDWDMDGNVDQQLPLGGFTSSGVAASAPHSWPSDGTKQFRAFTMDEQGNVSGWTQYQVQITTPPAVPTALITANPSSIISGDSSTLQWTCTNGTSASITGIGAVTPATGGSTSVSPLSTTSYTLTCTNATGSATDTITLTVTPPAQPDLTAGLVSPTTATAGTPVTLNATATNNGNAASGGFPILFQVQENNALFNSGYLGALAPSASAPGGATYTFPSAGTYHVRACANKNTSWADITPESDYSNNCGAYTTITVAAAIPPSISCTVSPTSINPGDTANYTASPANGATGPYSWLDSDGWTSSGITTSRLYATPGTYSMRVRASNTGYTYCATPLNVAAPYCAGPGTLTITASPDRVKAGNTATITWSATGVGGASPSCTISGPGVNQVVPAGALPTCEIPNGSATPVINAQSTYTISCNDGSTKSVTVNVIPKFVEF